MARRKSRMGSFFSGFNEGYDTVGKVMLDRELSDVSKVTETEVASGEEAQKAGLDAYNAALSAAETPEARARVEQDFKPTMTALEAEKARPASVAQSFGTGQNFQQVADKAALPDAQIAAREGIYRRHGNDEAADRLQDRALARKSTALQMENAQLQLSEGRDRETQRKTERLIDTELRGIMSKQAKKDEQGNDILDDAAMSNMFKARTLLAMKHGRPDVAEKTMMEGMQYNIRRIQSETAVRTDDTNKALALFDRNPKVALDIYNKYVPDGSSATDVVTNKDGSVTVKRVSTVDGAALPDQKFKDMASLRASVESIKDPNAVINHVERTFKHDIESRKLALEGSKVALAKGEKDEAKAEKRIKADAAVSIFKQNNPGASAAQIEAVRTGVLPAVAKPDGKDNAKLTDAMKLVAEMYGTKDDYGNFKFSPEVKDRYERAAVETQRLVRSGVPAYEAAQQARKIADTPGGANGYATPADLEAAIKSGKVKSGDRVTTPKGIIAVR